MKFTPCRNFQVAMSGASVPIAFDAIGTNADDMMLANSGTVPIAMRWGATAQTAVATDFTLIGGQSLLVTKGNGCGFFAAIGASGTLYVSPGETTL